LNLAQVTGGDRDSEPARKSTVRWRFGDEAHDGGYLAMWIFLGVMTCGAILESVFLIRKSSASEPSRQI
jgi:hypothetical protein